VTDAPGNQFSNQEQAGPPSPSGNGNVPFSAEQFATLLNSDPALRKAVADAASRQEQSNRDKRLSAFEKRLADFEKLMQGGLQRDTALTVLGLQEEMQELRQSTAVRTPSAGQPVSAPQTANPDYSPFLQAMALEANDPEVVNALRAGTNVPTQLAEIALRRRGGLQPNPAAVMPTSIGVPPANDLQAAYLKELEPLKGTGNMQALVAIKAKYRKAGLNV
jgi:hypothetical protein